jgi:hypothetical protein
MLVIYSRIADYSTEKLNTVLPSCKGAILGRVHIYTWHIIDIS